MSTKLLSIHAKYNEKVQLLLHELSQYSDDALHKRPIDGGWSPLQTAWHLLLVEELSYQYVQKKLHYGGKFDRFGLGARVRSFFLKIFLLLPFKFKAPVRTSQEQETAQPSFSELQERWLAINAKWQDFLSNMPVELLDKAVYKHPRAGRLSWLQMVEFFSQHFDRHLVQIRKGLNG